MQRPVLGGPADKNMLVVEVLSRKLQCIVPMRGYSYLDIGCGNGAFTLKLGGGFEEVWGIEIEPQRLKDL